MLHAVSECFSRSISLVSAVVRAPHLILLQVYEKPGFTHRGMQNMIKMHSMNCLLLLLQGVDPHRNLSTLLSAAECTQTVECTDMLALLFAAKSVQTLLRHNPSCRRHSAALSLCIHCMIGIYAGLVRTRILSTFIWQ